MAALLVIAFLVVFTQAVNAGVGCGRQAPGFEPHPKNRIINGVAARENSWPWMISQQASRGHYCGGSLLRVSDSVEASDIVLTAAHCVGKDTEDPDNYKNWTAIGGLYWQSYRVGVEVRNVVKAVKHPGFDDWRRRNDIALIKLDKPINFTDKIRPVCLPGQGEAAPVGKYCVATGWGRTSASDWNKMSDYLQQLEMPVHDPKQCLQFWGGPFDEENVALCAGAADGSSSTCNGDSGGVLACRADDGRWVQYGVVSFGYSMNCNDKDKPPVFASVSTFSNWIYETMYKMSSIFSG